MINEWSSKWPLSLSSYLMEVIDMTNFEPKGRSDEIISLPCKNSKFFTFSAWNELRYKSSGVSLEWTYLAQKIHSQTCIDPLDGFENKTSH